MTDTVSGRLSVNARGFGFLHVERPEGELLAFVAPPDMNGYFAGDHVRARVAESAPGRFSATHLALESRTRQEVFGTVIAVKGRPLVKVDRTVANWDVPIEGAHGFATGDPVVAVLDGAVARHVRVVPAPEVSLERVIVRRELPSEFTPEQLAAAKPHADVADGSRRDLRHLTTVTIDAASSRDLDDALAVLPAEADGALRLFVSIADVDAFVPQGSILDLEARRRGTSVYLAGRVLNMLPPALSEQASSLLPEVDRPALTVELRIDADGDVRSVDVYTSTIRSTVRLTYDAVGAFLDRGDEHAVPAVARDTLRWLRTAQARLSVARAARGGVELLQDEAYVTLDDVTGEPTAIEARLTTHAHRMVERLMVAANEAVARWLIERGLPGIFRVHPPPTEDRVASLAEAAAACGVAAGLPPKLTPRSLAAFEAQAKSLEAGHAHALIAVLQRALGPASYTADPSLHFGLAAPMYLHFTSPIRRYADLAVHRVAKAFLAGRRDFSFERTDFPRLAEALNDRTYHAAKAEGDRLHALAARHFAGRIGEVMDGRIVAIKPFGLVLHLGDAGVTGTVATEQLAGGPWAPSVEGHALESATRRYRLGEHLRVRVIGASEELGRIELAPEEGRRP